MGQQTEQKKVIVITGASSGFGRIAAELLARRGHTVYATMRGVKGKNAEHARSIQDLAKAENLRLKVVEMDVTKESQIEDAVAHIVEDAGRLDVLINNAGFAGFGMTETFSLDQARQLFETNFFGALAATRAVLPQMRAQRDGLLIHVTSGVGRLVFPGGGIYAATKFALEAMGETLRYEVAGLGIDSVMVEPGAFKTEIFGKFFEVAHPERAADYGEMGAVGEKFEAGLGEYFATPEYRGPEIVADAFVDLIESPIGSRPARVAVGADVKSVQELNEASARFQRAFLEQFGFASVAALA